jgi:hypothetical protein
MKEKAILKEVGAKTDITRGDDNALLKAIKDFFKKEKDATLAIQESQGDVITLDVIFKFKPENKATDRIEARQASYDIKRRLEEFLFKEFSITTLSIQGLNIHEDNVAFEISFIWKNMDGKKATYNESTKKSFTNSLGEVITLDSKISINGKKAKILEMKEHNVLFEVEGEKAISSYYFLENIVKTLKEDIDPEPKIIGSINPPEGLKERMYDLLEEYGDKFFENNPINHEDPSSEIHLIQIMTKAFQDALAEYKVNLKTKE